MMRYIGFICHCFPQVRHHVCKEMLCLLLPLCISFGLALASPVWPIGMKRPLYRKANASSTGSADNAQVGQNYLTDNMIMS